MIKQSQDEGGDEVTWRISPVNERLNAKSKQLPGVMRLLADSSRLNSMSIQKCSLNKACFSLASPSHMVYKCWQHHLIDDFLNIQDSVTSTGKLEKWLSSPPLKALENSLTLSDRASLTNGNLEHGLDFHGRTDCGNDKDKSGAEKSQSPFKTPPSLSYSNNKVIFCQKWSNLWIQFYTF